MINTYDYTFKKLIVETEYLFEVPNYQRNYVWGEKEIKQFLRDGFFCYEKYINPDKLFVHYAGQMIFRKLKKKPDGRERLEIIDGQQRLTTFMIIVTAAADLMREKNCCSETIKMLRQRYLLSSFHAQCIEDEKKLSLTKTDRLFWERLTDGCFADKDDRKLALESQKRLWQAYQMIRSYLEEIMEKRPEEKTETVLASYIKALSESFRVVVLMTEEPGYEFALYQIVNDRGRPLTSGEMLKARTIELFSDSENMIDRRERLINEAEEIWEDILSDPGETTEKYLRWNYMYVLGKKPDASKSVSLYEQYERDLFQCDGKREVSMDAQDEILKLLEQLRENVIACRSLAKGILPIPGASEQLNQILGILICNMKNTGCIPLYLKLLRANKEKKALAIAEKLTPMLAKTYFMARTMGNVNEESITNCYMRIWEKLDKQEFDLDEAKSYLRELLKKDKCEHEFFVKINQPVYARGAANFKSKFLLLMAELQYLKEQEPNSAEYGDDSVVIRFDKISVEHILHEGVEKNAVSSNFYESIHKIGNLTLLGGKPNGRMGAKPFEEKRTLYQVSPYYMTRKVGELAEWKYIDYSDRQKEMLRVLERAFAL